MTRIGVGLFLALGDDLHVFHSMARNAHLLVAVAITLFTSVSVVQALDVRQPARVRFVVQDDLGRPLPAAQVRMLASNLTWPLTSATTGVMTDERGTVVIERTRPANNAQFTWTDMAVIEKDGYLPRQEP